MQPFGVRHYSATLIAPRTRGCYLYRACARVVDGPERRDNCSGLFELRVGDLPPEQRLCAGRNFRAVGDGYGLVFANERFYLLDRASARIYAYRPSGLRDAAADISLPAASYPNALAFANDRFYITTATMVHAYSLTGAREPANDFELESSIKVMAFGDDHFFVSDRVHDNQIHVYNSSGERAPHLDFTLMPEHVSPQGLAYVDGRLYVLHWAGDVHAYLPSGVRDPDFDFDFREHSLRRFTRQLTFFNNRFYTIESGIVRVTRPPWIGRRNTNVATAVSLRKSPETGP